jgi:hypothetical protein
MTLRISQRFNLNKEFSMTKRLTFIAISALAASLIPLKSAFGQAAPEANNQADFLFVQTAKGMSFDQAAKKLTLTGVSPITLFFSDRPNRITGNMRTEAFVPFWSTGSDSFLSDPPNADISMLEGNVLKQVVVVLQDPVLEGDSLTYTIQILNGDLPATSQDVSVFIDVIGMPLTPVSYAGAARRAVIY